MNLAWEIVGGVLIGALLGVFNVYLLRLSVHRGLAFQRGWKAGAMIIGTYAARYLAIALVIIGLLKIEKIAMLLKAVLAAEGKVGLMLNIKKDDLDKIIDKIPALERPTVSSLAEEGWCAINTIVDEVIVRDLIPELMKNGAEGIVEYPLNKVV